MVDRVGQQFGNYRLVRLLGQGGFAEAYLKDPKQRFASVHAFAWALTQASQPASVPPPGMAGLDQSGTPTELIGRGQPAAQPPTPTLPGQLSRTQEVLPFSDGPLLPLKSRSAADTPSPSTLAPPQRGPSTRKILFLIGMAIIVIAGSLWLF